MHSQKKEAFHEPRRATEVSLTPTLSLPEWETRSRQRFMVPMHSQKRKEAFHEPRRATKIPPHPSPLPQGEGGDHFVELMPLWSWDFSHVGSYNFKCLFRDYLRMLLGTR